MAKTVHIMLAHPSPIDIWPLTRTAWGHIVQVLRRDIALLCACAEFRRCQAALIATPCDDEQGTDVAWAARKLATDRVAALRPETDRGRREKAAIAVMLLQEVPAWQRESEVVFALAAFRAEAA